MIRPCSIFLSLLTAVASGQTPPAPAADAAEELPALRARMAESLTVADRAVTARWIAALGELEKSRAAAGDYEGAVRARLRREQAQAAASSEDGRAAVLLPVKTAIGKGPGVHISDDQSAAMIKTSGAFVEWDLPGECNGWYEVRLTHAVNGRHDRSGEISPVAGPIPASFRGRRNDPDYSPPRVGGWVAFQNVNTHNRSDSVLRRELVSTGGWNEWRTVALGHIQLPPARIARLKLTGEEVAPEGLMNFRQLELVPISAPAPAGGEARLAALRETFKKTFRTQSTGSIATYRTALTALEQQAVRSRDNDLLFRVREELKRLALEPEQIALSSDEELEAAVAPIELTVGNSFGTSSRGDIVLDPSKAFLTKLRPPGTASITWRLPAFSVRSGTYDVAIKGVVPVSGGGRATLAAFGESSAPAGPPLKFEVKPVVTPEKRSTPLAEGEYAPTAERRTEQPGRVVIGKGALTLTVTVTGLTHPDGWLMDLSSLTLTRLGDVPAEKQKP